jgi:NADP-dependent 3-hydroxy acid dehydrogenase YdfG
METLRGKIAVITGAGSGFGREFARSAQSFGMHLVLADVQADALATTADELRTKGARVLTAIVDVADRTQVFDLALADRTYKEFGRANLLFNNAGVRGGGFLWESTERDWQWVMGVNVIGVVHGIQAFVPRMIAAERAGETAHLVNTASMAGWRNPPLMGVYNVSKHAVVSMTESLHHDLRLAGSTIGVSLPSPAFVPTGIANSQRNRPETLSNAAVLTPSQRMAQAGTEKGRVVGQDDRCRRRRADVRRGARQSSLCLHAS